MEKKFFIKKALDKTVLSLNEYNAYSFRVISTMYDKTILFFNTKEEAESYIIEHEHSGSIIVEVFI